MASQTNRAVARQMKISLITPEYPPMQGGVGDYTSRLARALRDLNLDISVITTTKYALGQEVDPGVSTVSDWGFDSWRHILDQVRRRRPDVLHIQYQTAGYGMRIAINLLPLRLRLCKWRPSVVTTFHDLKVPYVFPKAGRLRQLPGALLAAFSDAVIVTNGDDFVQIGESDPIGQGFRTRLGKRPLRVIPIGSNIPLKPHDGYDRARWRSSLGVGGDEFLLCYFGFLNSAKGIETLLAAFETLLARGKKVKLLMVGGAFGDSDPTNVAYGKRIMQTIDRSHYRERVLWTGFVGAEDVSASLLASDVCVLPFDEGASLRHGTLIAAICHGLPIVTTASAPTGAGRPSLVCPLPSLAGKVALVPPGEPDSLASAIAVLIASDTERAALRSKVSDLAAAFSWELIAGETLAAYGCLR
ncbi:MAG: glycosyltransferase [Chloroflexi bacterium]|nr:glycosyltransferase [Chloroflexota bacterium]